MLTLFYLHTSLAFQDPGNCVTPSWADRNKSCKVQQRHTGTDQAFSWVADQTTYLTSSSSRGRWSASFTAFIFLWKNPRKLKYIFTWRLTLIIWDCLDLLLVDVTGFSLLLFAILWEIWDCALVYCLYMLQQLCLFSIMFGHLLWCASLTWWHTFYTGFSSAKASIKYFSDLDILSGP